ncbi:peptidoglycan/LPS O-acetylase OafA/YrhL [Kribbella sp. VKM Ac-2569]|uniref:acyltransferase family protein n=1 Tax=Kribbella sp. VKM Ac-2569 TaxID=2512220 RepID=UPI00102B318C|nr:acyltransferase [Kribbella sp. VKM Ac-2569]RZT15250.1 peptidoglycan/LPS O-acetylase OafA/YrhL [Kribbella sp. VKM Ac-2569]
MTKAAEENQTSPTQEAPGSAAVTTPPPGAPVSTFPGDAGPPRPGKRLPRVESLTGLRWWAAFFVFCHHMTQLAPLPVWNFLKYGTSGVTFFFVLSGFVLTWSAQPGTKISTFYRRRFARIFPLYFLTLVAAVFVFYRFEPPAGMSWIKPVSMTVLVMSAFLVQGWSNNPTILYGGNPAGWTLSVEAFFYAYFPFVWRATQRLKTVGGLILCVSVLVLGGAYRLALFHYKADVPVLPQPVLHSVAFLFGIGLAISLRSGWKPRIPVWFAFLVTGGGLYLLWYSGLHPTQIPGAVTMGLCQKEVLTFLYGFLILAVAARDTRGGRSVLRSKPMVALGQWSYAFYLVHATILYAIKEYHGIAGPIGWSNLTWYAGVLVISIFASALLYKLVEHPLERKLRGPR